MTPDSLAEHRKKQEKSSLISRNITTDGHRTSVRLEPEMWTSLSDICRRERATVHEVCTVVARAKAANTSLTAAIRVFIMAYFRAASTEDGHARAGHGQGTASLSNAHAVRVPHSITSIAMRPPSDKNMAGDARG